MCSSFSAENLASSFKAQVRDRMVKLLDARQGKKLLVLDPQVSSLVKLSVDLALLREHGADQAQVLERNMQAVRAESFSSVLYILRPTAEACALLAAHVKACAEASPGLHFTAAFVPRRSLVCDQILSAAGLSRDVACRALPLEAAPLEPDLWSLELGEAARELCLEAATGPLYQAARAVHAIEGLSNGPNPIPLVQGFGPSAFRTLRILQDLAGPAPHPAPTPASSSGFSRLVLIDREVDWLSVLSTQLTYEGLVDEVLGVQGGTVLLPGQPGDEASQRGADGSSTSAPRPVRTPLNGTDRLFLALRDLPFSKVGPTLRERAVEIQQGYQQIKPDNPNAASVSVTGMRDFVRKLGSLPELQRHTDLAHALACAIREPAFVARMAVEQELVGGGERGLAALEELVADGRTPLAVVLRLLCLASYTTGAGLSKKLMEPVVRELTQGHGGEVMGKLYALQRTGLLRRSDLSAPGSSTSSAARPAPPVPFNALRKAFNLTPDLQQVRVDEMTDVSYVFAGFAPLSVRLVELALKSSRSLTDAADQLKSLLVSPRVTSAISTAPATADAGASTSSALETLGLSPACAQHVALLGAAPSLDPAPLVKWFELRRALDGEGRPALRPPPLDSRQLKGRGWRAAEILGTLGRTWLGYGPHRQDGDDEAELWGEEAADMADAAAQLSGSPTKRESVLVVFLGGVTFAEVSALRSISARAPFDFVVLTTGIVGGNSLVKQLARGSSGALEIY